MEWMLLPYKRYADFSGRSRRKEYWMFFLLCMIVNVVTNILAGIGGIAAMAGAVISIGFFLGSIVPAIAVAVRRAHDTDKSGWFMLIPIYNLILAVSEGTKGPNRFGPDPKDPGGAEVFA
jgi:uncharacterized membrane protein YhaH (DUF805 family)